MDASHSTLLPLRPPLPPPTPPRQPLPAPPLLNILGNDTEIILDMCGSVCLAFSPVQVPTSNTASYVTCSGARQFICHNGNPSSQRPVAMTVFPNVEDMISTFGDLDSFNNHNVLKPLCVFSKNQINAISHEEVSMSLFEYLEANRTQLVDDHGAGFGIHMNSESISTLPVNKKGPLDFTQLMKDIITGNLMGMRSMHRKERAHGPFDLTQIMVYIENAGDQAFEKPIVKLNIPIVSLPAAPASANELLDDFAYFGEAVLKMCRVLHMPDHQTHEIRDMCARLKDKSFVRVSDVLRHSCLSSHIFRSGRLKQCLQVCKKPMRRGATGENFPKGSWKAHFKLALDALQFIPGVRDNYNDTFTDFIEFSRNLLTHFWESKLLHLLYRSEVVLLHKLRSYYPLLFVDIE